MKFTKLIVMVVGICLLMASAAYSGDTATPSYFLDLPSRTLVVPDNLLFSTKSGLGMTFQGKVELEYVNVEGKGGFENQDLTVQKVRTRSPHVRIDKAVLEPKIYYSDNLTYQIEFRFSDYRAFVDKHYARLYKPKYKTVFELGKNRPMIYRKRQTEGYPLIGTAFWKGREYHLTSVTQLPLSDSSDMIIGLSGAMKRPLGSDDAAEDKSFKMLVYDDYLQLDGQTTEIGGMLGASAGNMFSLLGWYYYGELIDDYDWKIQLSQNFQDYDDLGDPTDRTHHWYGGRAGLDIGNFTAMGEYDRSQDGNLPRYGYSVEGGYAFPAVAKWLNAYGVKAIVRYDVLDVEDHPENLGNPQTWDRQMTTAALLTEMTKELVLKIEYYWINEVTGGEAPDDQVADDTLLIQLRFTF